MLIVGLIVSSTLLVCDAWFDVVTSLGTEDEMLTLLTALAIELPLAIYFALLTRARAADRRSASAGPSTRSARCTPCRSPPTTRTRQSR